MSYQDLIGLSTLLIELACLALVCRAGRQLYRDRMDQLRAQQDLQVVLGALQQDLRRVSILVTALVARVHQSSAIEVEQANGQEGSR